MDKTIYVIIACDTDPDRAGFVNNVSSDTLSWEGMLKGIPSTKNRLKEIRDTDNKSPVFTWCLRVDHQIAAMCGEMDYVLKSNRHFLQELLEDGDELAWHPHFWRYDTTAKIWYQEFNDKEWQKAMLEEGFAAFKSNFTGLPKTVRMGWDYHSQESFETINQLGLEIDISAIPGQRLAPAKPDSKGSNFYDWYNTPRIPFQPSTQEYRRPAKDGEKSYSTKEFPVFVTKSIFWSLFGSLVLALKMKDPLRVWHGLRRPSYFINITGNTTLFTPLISQLKRDLSQNNSVYFVTFFHADEVFGARKRLYSLDYMDNNLSLLRNFASKSGARLKYIRACDLANHFPAAP